MRVGKELITVFTPTYNRADTIHRVWESLKGQDDLFIEWIVVDDGSSDGIEAVISEYKSQASFPVLFYKLPKNRGKHIAINKGVELASGVYFLIADSDDRFKSNSISFFRKAWENVLIINPSHETCAIRVCCEDQYGVRVSSKLSKSPLVASMRDAYYIHEFTKESWSMDRTDLMRQYPFPNGHQGYFPEGIIWKKISEKRKVIFYDESLRIYYREDTGSIMKSSKTPKQKINRNIAVGKDILDNDISYFKYKPKYFFFIATLYGYYSMVESNFVRRFLKLNGLAKVLVGLTLPASLLFYVKTKIVD